MIDASQNTLQPKILLVDDDEGVRSSLVAVLEISQFRVTAAANVSEAFQVIAKESFDVLLCDLHMPGAGDGFTVVSAMRHTNPEAVTLVFTGYPEIDRAMNAILLQADEILVKPLAAGKLLSLIREKLEKKGTRTKTQPERVPAILERDAATTISNWLTRVETDSELTIIPLDPEQRTGHIPTLISELVQRLRVPRALGTKQTSAAALQGKVRQSQGYTIPMIIEESRILQVSIFQTLQNNLSTVDFSLLLVDVMTIADEVDSQLKQTIVSFSEQIAAKAA